MKSLQILCLLLGVVLHVSAQGAACGRGCVPKCKDNEELYVSGCKPVKPEPCCGDPNPVVDEDAPGLCDWMACYCKSPKVRYLCNGTGRCVDLEDCPPQYGGCEVE